MNMPKLPELKKLKGEMRPPRIILNAIEGWGKTSVAAHATEPAILQAAGETGYETLLGAKRVPSVPCARINTWTDLIGVLQGLVKECPYKVLALDAAGGFERLCHQKVCVDSFNGEWGEKGFTGWQRGYIEALPIWQLMLQLLDKIRDEHNTTILILSHSQIKPFKNPEGPDFDQYVSNLHPKTWAITCKWADCVLFGKFITIVDEEKGRKKGIGGKERVLYTERRDAWEAKNRLGMPEEILIPNDPSKVWNVIREAMLTGMKVGTK